MLFLFTIQADEPSEETTAEPADAATTTTAAETKPEDQPAAESTAESDPIKEAAAPMEEAPKEEAPNEEPAKEEPAEEERPKEDTPAAAPVAGEKRSADDAAVTDEKKVRTGRADVLVTRGLSLVWRN